MHKYTNIYIYTLTPSYVYTYIYIHISIVYHCYLLIAHIPPTHPQEGLALQRLWPLASGVGGAPWEVIHRAMDIFRGHGRSGVSVYDSARKVPLIGHVHVSSGA